MWLTASAMEVTGSWETPAARRLRQTPSRRQPCSDCGAAPSVSVLRTDCTAVIGEASRSGASAKANRRRGRGWRGKRTTSPSVQRRGFREAGAKETRVRGLRVFGYQRRSDSGSVHHRMKTSAQSTLTLPPPHHPDIVVSSVV